jgi:hypothetical protein
MNSTPSVKQAREIVLNQQSFLTMKKSKLVLAGIAIGMSAMLVLQQHHPDNNKQLRKKTVQQDSAQQNAPTGIPLVRIGLQSNLY